MDAASSSAPPAGGDLPPARDAAGQALARALWATLDAVEQAAGDADAVEMVHDARKAMKQYRALLRLVPGAAARAARQDTAAVARELSGSRDRAAAREAIQILEEEGLLLACDFADAVAAIGSDAPEDADAQGHREALLAFLARARMALETGLAAQAEAADVGRGIARAYRKGRQAVLDAPPDMHEGRKQVVIHRYQMSLLAEAFAGRARKRAVRAQKLRDLLGAYQDMEILRPMLRAAVPPLGTGTLERLEVAMAREQKRLKKRAASAHAALYRRRAGAFLRKYRDIL
ncbi:CHAD domain-containing protein [Xanthobacter sp. AM11]|uniref:CHAD domain-containing protein n=1 Tax=Xanthobacter sp. AM11 TaxID=3380643 RepID=UPI0039BFF9BB